MPIIRFSSLVLLLKFAEQTYQEVWVERRDMDLVLVATRQDGTEYAALLEQHPTSREVEQGDWLVNLE